MKKLILATASIAIVVGSLFSAQAAVNTAVAVPGSFAGFYGTPEIVLSKSAPATFVNLDIDNHDIRSDAQVNGQPLFKSAIIPMGETSTIEGLDRADSGETYGFFCKVHPDMRGNATIVD